MPRPLNLKVRERILDAASRLIHARGYQGASMDDVAAKAGIKKANLFHYYPTKEALGLAVLERAALSNKERISSRFSNGADPARAVGRMFMDYAERMEKDGCAKGCLIGNLAQEVSDHSERMRRELSAQFAFWTETLARFLEDHKQAGRFRKELNSVRSARALVCLLEGAVLISKAERSTAALDDARSMASVYLEVYLWNK